MLGVRRLGGVQVDLYQGDPETFVCDARVSSAAAVGAVDGKRHVVLVPPSTAVASEVMQEVRDALMKRTSGSLGRVTVILSSLDHYWSFQDALFSLFPDEE